MCCRHLPILGQQNLFAQDTYSHHSEHPGWGEFFKLKLCAAVSCVHSAGNDILCSNRGGTDREIGLLSSLDHEDEN